MIFLLLVAVLVQGAAPPAGHVESVLEALDEHTATVLVLTGYRETAKDWVERIERIQKELPWVKFVIATGRVRSISSTTTTIESAKQYNAWFDLISTWKFYGHKSNLEDSTGIREARRFIRGLIDYELENTKIPSTRLGIVGYDMGGTVGILTALTHEKPFGALAGMNTFVWLRARITDERKEPNKKLKVLLTHGKFDETVPFESFEESEKFLRRDLQQPVERHTYDVAHEFTDEMEDDLRFYLSQMLPAPQKASADPTFITLDPLPSHEDL